jgi:hypothetical protein
VFTAAERRGHVTDVSVAEPSLETVPSTSPKGPARRRQSRPRSALVPSVSPSAGARTAFRALLLRDLVVVRKTWKEVLPRTLIQPFLLVFVFAYVFPKIGQGIGGRGGESEFSTLLVAGVIGLAIMFQGIQSVAIPMVQEFGYTRDRGPRGRRCRCRCWRSRTVAGVERLVRGDPRVPHRRDRTRHPVHLT